MCPGLSTHPGSVNAVSAPRHPAQNVSPSSSPSYCKCGPSGSPIQWQGPSCHPGQRSHVWSDGGSDQDWRGVSPSREHKNGQESPTLHRRSFSKPSLGVGMEPLRPGEPGPRASREVTVHNGRKAVGTRVVCWEVAEVSLPACRAVCCPLLSLFTAIVQKYFTNGHCIHAFFSWIKEKSQPDQMRILGGWAIPITVCFVM